MTRPKTYGEFADTNEYTCLDERLRDREISDDAWRILNMHNEIPEDVKDHFDIQDVTVSYVDYHDDDNVAIVATTKDCYEPIIVSAVVGDRFEATVDCLTDCDRETLEFEDSEEMFEVLEEALIDGIEQDLDLRVVDRERFADELKRNPDLANSSISKEPWKTFRPTFYDQPGVTEYAFLERVHRQIQARYDGYGANVQMDDCEIGGVGEDNIGLDIHVSWSNPEHKDEKLRRRIQMYAMGGCLEFEHDDDIQYVSKETDTPLKVQYHMYYGRDGQGIPFDKNDIHTSFDAVMAKVDNLLADSPAHDTILPMDIKALHELRLSTVAPHVQDVVKQTYEHLYVSAFENPDGTVDRVHVDLSAIRDRYVMADTRLMVDQHSDTSEWTIKIKSKVGDTLEDVTVADDASWKLELDKSLRAFGEFVESEYIKSVVSDLDDQNHLEQ